MKRTFTHCFMVLQNTSRSLKQSSDWLRALLLQPARRGLVLKTVLLVTLASSASFVTKAQQNNNVTVTGNVVDDADGAALPSVTITDAKRKVLGVTDAAGFFRIVVPRNAQVRFSFIGYAATLKTFDGNQKVVVRMPIESSKMNEVVVTALGIKREAKALGYAQTTLNGEDLTSALSANWTDALSGKVAGLNLIRSNSGPAGSNKIILRGENNITGDNEALIVVDGVITNGSGGARRTNGGQNGAGQESVYSTNADNLPADYGSSINDINPEDIESVTVLKGPAAAALYGSRAANGAIMITTKSGSSKRKGFGVTINSNYSRESVNRWPAMQFEYGQGTDGLAHYSYGNSADGASTSGTSSAFGPRFNGQNFFQYDPARQDVGLTRTPWVGYTNKIRQFFETGSTRTNTITVDGAGDRTSARLSITNVGNTWITPNTGYDRNTVAFSSNSKVNDKLTIATKINYTNNKSDNLPGAGYGNQSIMYWFIFWQPSADLDWLKNYSYWQRGFEGRRIEYPFSSFPENPYAVSYEFINSRNRNSIIGNVTANYAITKELNLQLRTAMDMAYDQREQRRPYDAGTRLPKGSFRYQNAFSREITSDFLLRYTKKASKDFQVTATLGGSLQKTSYDKDEIRADSLLAPGVYQLSNGLGAPTVYPDAYRLEQQSLYGLVSLSYRDYLYMDLTARNDWSSALATRLFDSKTSFFYPSASLSFVPSELNSWKLPKQINYAKFRASIAGAGSGGNVAYRKEYRYQVAGGGLFPGSGLQNNSLLANPFLGPLNTLTLEVGAEARLFNNRFGFDVALYTGRTKDQHLLRELDRASGFGTFVTNLGQVNNKGIEIAANGTPIKTKDFKWDLNITFTANRNKIVDVGSDSSFVLRTGPLGSGQIVVKKGGALGDLYGLGFERSPDGQIVYDALGYPVVAQDIKYLGNTMPRFRSSAGTNITYKQFRLNVLFDAQFGAVAHSLTYTRMTEMGKSVSSLPGRYAGIIGNGVVKNANGTYSPNTTVVTDLERYYQFAMGSQTAEGGTYSTDYIKFREANITYNLPTKLLSKVHIQRASLGVYGRNLFIWSPWPAFDPEFGTLAGSDIVTGFEIAQFPSTRTFGVNLIIGF